MSAFVRPPNDGQTAADDARPRPQKTLRRRYLNATPEDRIILYIRNKGESRDGSVWASGGSTSGAEARRGGRGGWLHNGTPICLPGLVHHYTTPVYPSGGGRGGCRSLPPPPAPPCTLRTPICRHFAVAVAWGGTTSGRHGTRLRSGCRAQEKTACQRFSLQFFLSISVQFPCNSLSKSPPTQRVLAA